MPPPVQSVSDAASLGAALGQTSPSVTTALLVLSAVFALLNCFFGVQLKKIWITVIGFLLGFLIGFAPCALLIKADFSPVIAAAVGLGVGVLVALIAYRLYRVGVFLWVALLTFGSVSAFFGDRFEWLGIVLGVVVGLVVGALSLVFLRPVCILSTGVSGGMLAAQNFAKLFSLPGRLLPYGIGAVLAVLGVAVQFTLSAASHRKAQEAKAAKAAGTSAPLDDTPPAEPDCGGIPSDTLPPSAAPDGEEK